MDEQDGEHHVDGHDQRGETRPEPDDDQRRGQHFAHVDEVAERPGEAGPLDDVEDESRAALDLADAVQQDQDTQRDAEQQFRRVRGGTAASRAHRDIGHCFPRIRAACTATSVIVADPGAALCRTPLEFGGRRPQVLPEPAPSSGVNNHGATP